MDYRGNDNWSAWSSDSERARARRRQEREFRERTEQAREAERERLEPRRLQPAHHQARRPSPGTWYERERNPSARRRPDELRPEEHSPRWQQPQVRRSVPLQHERYAANGDWRARQQTRPRPPQRTPAQLNRGYGTGYAGGQELSSRDIGIRVAIVAVLLVVFLVRIATFGGCARSSELDTQISEQQAQLQQLTDANAQAQAQLDAMQSSIDSYDQLLSSSSSSAS